MSVCHHILRAREAAPSPSSQSTARNASGLSGQIGSIRPFECKARLTHGPRCRAIRRIVAHPRSAHIRPSLVMGCRHDAPGSGLGRLRSLSPHAYGPLLRAAQTAGDLVVSKAWTRQPPDGGRVAGGYMTITNKGSVPDRLVGGSAAFAKRFEVHEMSMAGRRHEDARTRQGARDQARPGGGAEARRLSRDVHGPDGCAGAGQAGSRRSCDSRRRARSRSSSPSRRSATGGGAAKGGHKH